MRIVQASSLQPESIAAVVALAPRWHPPRSPPFSYRVTQARREKLRRSRARSIATRWRCSSREGAAPITTLEERLELIAETGIETTVVIPFTRAIALSSRSLRQGCPDQDTRSGEIVVGFNHRSGGRARQPDCSRASRARSASSAHLPAFTMTASRSRHRRSAERSSAATSRQPPGSWPSVSIRGEVVRGAGADGPWIPTANVKTERPLGCRSVSTSPDRRARRPISSRRERGRASDVRRERAGVEAHLLDFVGDLYNERVTLTFLRRSGGAEFPSVDALRSRSRSTWPQRVGARNPSVRFTSHARVVPSQRICGQTRVLEPAWRGSDGSRARRLEGCACACCRQEESLIEQFRTHEATPARPRCRSLLTERVTPDDHFKQHTKDHIRAAGC